MADVLTYVLHYEGAFNKNSLGAVSEGAARASEIGGQCHAVVVGGDDLTDELCASLGKYGAQKVFRARGAEGLAQPVIDVMSKVIDTFVEHRIEGERFIETYNRIGITPFKERVYASRQPAHA